MKKILIAIALIFVSAGVNRANATATETETEVENPRVEITSFLRMGDWDKTKAGEVCGRLHGLEGNVVPLQVVADYRYRAPGYYVTHADKQGRFCHVIHTLRGEVEVSIMGQAADMKDEADAFFSKKR